MKITVTRSCSICFLDRILQYCCCGVIQSLKFSGKLLFKRVQERLHCALLWVYGTVTCPRKEPPIQKADQDLAVAAERVKIPGTSLHSRIHK
jgi:hypothetical protein